MIIELIGHYFPWLCIAIGAIGIAWIAFKS